MDKENETLIANINQIAELFGVQKAAISKHLNNIFKEGELKKASTVSILETVQTEGKRTVERKIEFYNLDAIIAAGYRVNSKQATNFRIWATKILKSYLLDGYAVNKKQIAKNYEKFIETLNEIKALSAKKKDSDLNPSFAIDLVKGFAETWLSLDAYDKDNLKNYRKCDAIFWRCRPLRKLRRKSSSSVLFYRKESSIHRRQQKIRSFFFCVVFTKIQPD